MKTPLPLASYIFILRKHRWLVLGTVAVVLAGGYLYTRDQIPVYRAVAKVRIQPRLGAVGEGPAALFREDTAFISDQIYRIRTNERLADEVLARVRDPENADAPDKVLFADLGPRSLLGMVSVRGIPGTSYYDIAIEGPEPRVNFALANAYAFVFEEVFRREQKKKLGAFEEEYRDQLEGKQAKLDKIGEEVAELKKANDKVDFDRAKNPDKEQAELLQSELVLAKKALIAREQELLTVEETAKSVGVTLSEADGGAGVYALLPSWTVGGDADPRLHPRLQSLSLVNRDEAVQKTRVRIEANRDEDARLGGGLKPLAPGSLERSLLKDAHAKLLARLALETEACITELAREVAQARNQTKLQEENVLSPLQERAAATTEALAEFERLGKRAEDVKMAMAGVEARMLEAVRQREKAEGSDTAGLVQKYEDARAEDFVLVRPNKPVMFLVTCIAAVLLAAALAYVLEFMDDTVKSREDFDRLVRLPFLGFVPHIEDADGRDLVAARGRTGSPVVESFRAIRTGVQFSRPDREVRSCLITSAGPGEGKTTVCVNLAATFAGGAGRVLLIDADLRRSRIHSALGVENRIGLTTVLVGSATLAEAVQRSSVENLDVLASGPIPPNPAEVLGSARMREVLAEAIGAYDRVVIDSPPLAAVTDPALLAKSVDGVFLVVAMGKTSVRLIQRARETLAAVGCAVHGAILNNSDSQHFGYYGYYRSYGYGYGYGYGYESKGGAPEGAAAAADGALPAKT